MGNRHLTILEEMILREIEVTGQVRSLFKLADTLDCDYGHLHKLVKRLEREQRIRIVRSSPGSPLVLQKREDNK